MVVNQEKKGTVSHPRCIKFTTARLSFSIMERMQRVGAETRRCLEQLGKATEDRDAVKLAPLTYHKSPQKQ